MYLDRTYPAIEALRKQCGIRMDIFDILENWRIISQQEPDHPFFIAIEKGMKQHYRCLTYLSLWGILRQGGFQGGIGTNLKILSSRGVEPDHEVAKQEFQNVLDAIESLLRKHRTCCGTINLDVIQPEALADHNGTYLYEVAYSTLQNWAWDNTDDITRARRWSGGWEPWLQVEMANALQKAFEQRGGEVEREVKVYKDSRQIVDLVAKGPHPFEPSKHFHLLIELKAQGKNRSAWDFREVVKKDVKKVIEGRVNEEYQPAQFLSWNFFDNKSRENGKEAIKGAVRARPVDPEELDTDDRLDDRLRDEIIGPLDSDIVLTEFSTDVQNLDKPNIKMSPEDFAVWKAEHTAQREAFQARWRGVDTGEGESSTQTSTDWEATVIFNGGMRQYD